MKALLLFSLILVCSGAAPRQWSQSKPQAPKSRVVVVYVRGSVPRAEKRPEPPDHWSRSRASYFDRMYGR